MKAYNPVTDVKCYSLKNAVGDKYVKTDPSVLDV